MRTRAALREAATTVFARHGVAGASIEEICEEGGFTRGAFYSNYSSKDELVLDIIEQQLTSVSEDAQELLAGLASGEASVAGGAGGAGCAVTPGNKRRILSELLAHFRLPFISTPSAFIAYREISLHAMRNQDLRARMDEVSRVHEEQLTSVVNALLTVHGARLLIEVEDLVAICIGCYHVAAETAVAVAPEAERVEVDTSRLLAVLIAFIRFPGEEGTETAGL